MVVNRNTTNPAQGTKKPVPDSDFGRKTLTPQQRRFVLRSVAEYKSDLWIVGQLAERWGLIRSHETIHGQYRHNHQYKAQIAKYRKAFDESIGDEPLANKRVILQFLHQGAEIAVSNKDAKALAAVLKQALELGGHYPNPDIEPPAGDPGQPGFEQILAGLMQTDANNKAQTAKAPMLEGDVVEAEYSVTVQPPKAEPAQAEDFGPLD